jgi:hypothetical protein
VAALRGESLVYGIGEARLSGARQAREPRDDRALPKLDPAILAGLKNVRCQVRRCHAALHSARFSSRARVMRRAWAGSRLRIDASRQPRCPVVGGGSDGARRVLPPLVPGSRVTAAHGVPRCARGPPAAVSVMGRDGASRRGRRTVRPSWPSAPGDRPGSALRDEACRNFGRGGGRCHLRRLERSGSKRAGPGPDLNRKRRRARNAPVPSLSVCPWSVRS